MDPSVTDVFCSLQTGKASASKCDPETIVTDIAHSDRERLTAVGDRSRLPRPIERLNERFRTPGRRIDP